MDSKELKFLLTHSSIYGLGTMISQAVAFILLPVYTRHLTPQDYGILEIIDSTNMLIGIIITIGLGRGLSRFYYEQEEAAYRNAVVSTSYYIIFAISLVFLPVLISLGTFASKMLFSTAKYKQYFTISFISLFLGAVIDIGLIYFRLEKQPIKFISITVTRLISLITLNIYFIVYLNMGVLGILYSTLIVRVGYTLLVSFLILIRTNLRFSYDIAQKLVRFCLPLIPSNLLATLIKQSDKYFILYFLTVADAGIYSLALKLGNAMHILITVPFIMVYVPRRFEIMKAKSAQETYRVVFTYYSFIFIILGLTGSILIPEIMRIMATPKFHNSTQYIPLIILSMFVFGTQYHFDFGILYSKKTKYFAYINLIIAGMHLGLNYTLISHFGMWGAITASIIVLGTQSALYLNYSQKFYKINFELLRVGQFLFLAVLTFLISKLINFDNIVFNIVVKLSLLIAFFLTTVLFNIIRKEETTVAKSFVSKRIFRRTV